jgi:hypothetical protein
MSRPATLEELQAIEHEAQQSQRLDAPLSFEPLERTMARMVFEARAQLAAKDAALTDALKCLAKVVEAHRRAP